MKEFLVVANWKANQGLEATTDFLRGFKDNSIPSGLRVVLCPTHSFLGLADWSQIEVFLGAQDVSRFAPGSYTGEVTASFLKDLGVEYCLVGHSERRRFFGENTKHVAAKVERLWEKDITPVVCLGSLEELYALDSCLGKETKGNLRKTVFCFEPTDYISSQGEFKAIDPDLIEVRCRDFKTVLGKEASVLYGGSVTPQNSLEIKNLPSVDGLLVGQVSLKYQDFLNLLYELR